MALAIATVTNSIAALTVSGLTIKDIDEIPASVVDANCPVIYPEPLNLMTNLVDEPAHFGEGANSDWNVEYDLTYTLCYCPVGDGREMENFAPAIDKANGFIYAIMKANPLTGAVLVRATGISEVGPVPDPSGNLFIGCRITVHVLEFVS